MTEAVDRGMRTQLEQCQRALALGDRRIGWKVALNQKALQDRFGLERPAVGYLLASAEVGSAGIHALAGCTSPRMEAEVAIHLGRDLSAKPNAEEAAAAIAGLGAAIEIVDIDRAFDDIEAILSGNVFQRAVRFSARFEHKGLAGVRAILHRNGKKINSADASVAADDPAEVLVDLAASLAEHGEFLRKGDRIIAGSLFPPSEVSPGDRFAFDLGPLGSVEIEFSA